MHHALRTTAAGIALTLIVGSSSIPRIAAQAPESRVSGALTVTTVANGLNHPWSLAFLPDGSMLLTERIGRLRIIRNGVLDPTPVAGVPAVHAVLSTGLMDVLLHPKFSENRFVYLSYSKAGPPFPPGTVPMRRRFTVPCRVACYPSEDGKPLTATLAVARGQWDGTALTNVREILVADDWKDPSISLTNHGRMIFGRDGMLYVTDGGAMAPASSGPYAHSAGGRAQDPTSHGGKVLRLTEDGGVPPDNPFVGRPGYKPEIYTLGHRQPSGLAVHPETGAIWETEIGPLEGDEINILKPGANYGWPVTGMGRDYNGDYIGGRGSIGEPGRPDASNVYMPGMEQPVLFYTPSMVPSGMLFYTGERIPQWKGSLLVGLLDGSKGRRLERHVFNDKGWPVRREYYLEDLKQRIRDVRQGPDGFVYVLTDENPGAVLRLELTK